MRTRRRIVPRIIVSLFKVLHGVRLKGVVSRRDRTNCMAVNLRVGPLLFGSTPK